MTTPAHITDVQARQFWLVRALPGQAFRGALGR